MALYRNIAGVELSSHQQAAVAAVIPIIDKDTSTLPDPEDLPGVPNLGGEVDFEAPIPGNPASENTAQQQTTPKNFVPLIAVAGVLAVAIGGNSLIKRGSKLVFAGGIGALFYLLSRKSTTNG